jgi:hypothetical protein
VYYDVPFGGLVGDNVTVRANTTVRPGAIVGIARKPASPRR